MLMKLTTGLKKIILAHDVLVLKLWLCRHQVIDHLPLGPQQHIRTTPKIIVDLLCCVKKMFWLFDLTSRQRNISLSFKCYK